MSEHNQREDDHRQNEICHRIMHQTTPMGPILECVLFSKKNTLLQIVKKNGTSFVIPSVP